MKSLFPKLFLIALIFSVSQSVQLKNLGIYYGYPSSFNYNTNAWNLDNVITDMSQYDVLVLGDSLETIGHSDHSNTEYIISCLDGDAEVFGYVDIGNTASHTLIQMKQSVDSWETMGVHGIFLDQFGFDYWNNDTAMRTDRQNPILDYIHSKGLKAFVNAWNPDDVFTKLPATPSTI